MSGRICAGDWVVLKSGSRLCFRVVAVRMQRGEMAIRGLRGAWFDAAYFRIADAGAREVPPV